MSFPRECRTAFSVPSGNRPSAYWRGCPVPDQSYASSADRARVVASFMDVLRATRRGHGRSCGNAPRNCVNRPRRDVRSCRKGLCLCASGLFRGCVKDC
jgi:hypothetical protein